jgi:hypothetical protein
LNALTSFTLGFAVSQVPTLAYMILDPQSFTYTVLLFHLLRQPSGLTPLRMLSVAENITLTLIISICHTIIAVAVYLAILAYLARNEVDIMRGSALTLLHFLAFSKVVHEQFYLPLYPLLLQLRIREARLIEAIFTSYTLVNTGLIPNSPHTPLPHRLQTPTTTSLNSLRRPRLHIHELHRISSKLASLNDNLHSHCENNSKHCITRKKPH